MTKGDRREVSKGLGKKAREEEREKLEKQKATSSLEMKYSKAVTLSE